MIKTVDFQVISFTKSSDSAEGFGGDEVVQVYSLGEDGLIRVFEGSKWKLLPIEEDGLDHEV